MVPMNIINLYENYNSYFSSEFKEIFKLCSQTAFKNGYRLYLIGGLVRDMLLNEKSNDIDITVKGDAIEFAHLLEKELNVKILSIHKDFGTAKVLINGEKIDLASTRSETYPKKGHLPQVAEIGCSLEKDVLRRDFTINSLALSLNEDNFAQLIDYVGGFEDLKAKKVKILHEKSFIDDPTRILRALKYSTRLGFEVEGHSLKLQEEYLENINYDMCCKRVKQELKKTFETNSQKAFDKFIEQKIYKLITSNNQFLRNAELVSASNKCTTLERSRNKFGMTSGLYVQNIIEKYKPKHAWIVYLGLIAVFETDEFCDKLELTKIEKNIILDAKSLLNSKLETDFEIYKAFCTQKLETLLILAAFGKEEQVLKYLELLQKTRLHINGNDLLQLGFEPSKAFSKGFDFVLKQKLQNPRMKKQEELEIIKKYLSK